MSASALQRGKETDRDRESNRETESAIKKDRESTRETESAIKREREREVTGSCFMKGEGVRKPETVQVDI